MNEPSLDTTQEPVSHGKSPATFSEPGLGSVRPSADKAELMDLVFEDRIRAAQSALDEYKSAYDPYLREARIFDATQALLLAVAALRNIEGMGSGSVESPLLAQAMQISVSPQKEKDDNHAD